MIRFNLFTYLFFALTSGIVLLSLASCQQPSKNADSSNNSLTNYKSKPDLLLANIDTTISPGNDFFAYANGTWLKANPIPADESSWGIWNLVEEENYKRLLQINETAAKNINAASGSAEQKIGNFWAMAMDSTLAEKLGLTPLEGMLTHIDAALNLNSMAKLLAELGDWGVHPLLGYYIGQDNKNSEKMMLTCYQTGLGLPDREYYFKKDSATIAIRNTYVQVLENILTLSGRPAQQAKTSAAAILKFEMELAKSHKKLEDLRDPYANYNKMSLANFYKLTPTANWQLFFEMNGLTRADSVIVGQPAYYKALEKALKTTDLTMLKDYLRLALINSYSEALPNAFGQTYFELEKALEGVEQRKPRWKRTLQLQDNLMGELLGGLYVKQYFNETAKKRYTDLVEAIRAAYKIRIEKLTWMSDSTKQRALVKLAAMKKKVGYPDTWKDFSQMEMTRDNYVVNLKNANKWWHRYELNKLGKPVNKNEWDMSPQTYNAYYNPSNNEIVLPAGIFTVPGYADHELDDALVFGYAAASTIGHEITHGFDDEGRQYDANGNLKNWWTKADEKQFKQRAQVMVKQFSKMVVVDTFKINGQATLGENLADLGGVLLGWDAYTQTPEYKAVVFLD